VTMPDLARRRDPYLTDLMTLPPGAELGVVTLSL
jgi:hypothetical protein